ncbi:MAG: diguanylate cyclase [Rhodoferax sp.]|nr:diguanylate cyclase [Rhodoferax sp.]
MTRWFVANLAASILLASSANASPERFRALEALADDDAKRAIAVAGDEASSAAGAEPRFWALLARGRAQSLLEREADLLQTYEQAEEVLAHWSGASPRHRLWLASSRLLASWRVETPEQSMKRLLDLRARLREAHDPYLECDFKENEVVILFDAGSLDEAWLAAEDWERCARNLGMLTKEAWAISMLGTIASRGQGRTQVDPDDLFARAIAVLAEMPARTLRNALLYQRAESLRVVGRLDAAAGYYRDSVSLARETGDEAAIAAGANGLAAIHLEQGEPAKSLPLLQEALALLEPTDSGFRMLNAASQLVKAYTMLKHPDLPSAMALVRRYDNEASPGADRARVARIFAAAYASQGRFKEAYAESERADRLAADGRRYAAEIQNLRLQARYSAAQREAENAELRHRSESARLALAAEEATRRALWAAVGILVVLLLAASSWAWSGIARRRALTHLALRDDLTGKPNRRAVTGYAKDQFDIARQKDTPLTMALIDLDHFKRVNDLRGHACGDAVLRALAAASSAVLRDQDVLGRWGGEEWLLVLPGVKVEELPAIFERLRHQFASTPVDGIDGEHGVTFSMGGAGLSPSIPSLDALIAACDERLYRAKDAGRDRLCHDLSTDMLSKSTTVSG